MADNIRYVHTNIIARDWKRLAQFYIDVFGCRPAGPERHISGDWIDKLTGIPGARIDGAHLQLPGYEDGPTLEIFQYTPEKPRDCPSLVNRPGFGHIAFHVGDVEAVRARLVAHGGRAGEVVQNVNPALGLLTVAYAQDPEGNFIEIQSWKK
jgi:predicted enzyme related to lactoylglutathione lyase